MSDIQYPPDLMSQVMDLQRRISMIERVGSTPSSTRVVDTQSPPMLRLFEGQLDGISGLLYGNSYTYPAGTYGVTVLDGGGAIVFDSLGASQSGKVLTSSGPFGTISGLAFTTSQTGIPATNATWTLQRPATILIQSNITFYGNGGTANYVFANVTLLNPATSSINAINSVTTPQTISTGSPYFVVKLPAGSYTAQIQYYMQGGATTTMTLYNGRIDIIQMGG